MLSVCIRNPAGSTAARLEFVPLGSKPQKPNAVTISDAYEQIEVESECLIRGQEPAAPAIFVAKLNRVLGTTEHLTQFSPIEQHVVEDSSGVSLPDDPWGEGRNQAAISE